MPRKLWDFKDPRGHNVIKEWGERQTTKDQAKLDQKFDRLGQLDFELALGTKLLAGPIKNFRHIYKMTIHGQVQLRPMLCKGPQDLEREYTLLVGAIEKDFRLTPSAGVADSNRTVLVAHSDRRGPHERIKT